MGLNVFYVSTVIHSFLEGVCERPQTGMPRRDLKQVHSECQS